MKFVSAAIIVFCLFCAAVCPAATLIVDFKVPPHLEADFHEVHVGISKRQKDSCGGVYTQVADFETTRTRFRETFSDLETAIYQVEVYTGTPETKEDANRPGAFNHSEALLLEPTQREIVKVYYKDFNREITLGNGILRGRLEGVDGTPMAHVMIEARAMEPTAGSYTHGITTTDEEGVFQFRDVLTQRVYTLFLEDGRAFGSAQADSKITHWFVLPRGPGDAAPPLEFVELPSGKDADLEDYRGTPVLAVFWASWSEPSLELLRSIHGAMTDDEEIAGLVTCLAISLDRERVDAEAAAANNDWETIRLAWMGGQDQQSPNVRHFGVACLPTVVLIDSDGKIVYAGSIGSAQLPEILDKLIPNP